MILKLFNIGITIYKVIYINYFLYYFTSTFTNTLILNIFINNVIQRFKISIIIIFFWQVNYFKITFLKIHCNF